MTARIRAIFVVLAVMAAPFACAQEPNRNEFDIADHAGKVVVLDFWASWCGPCRRSFPWLNEMHARYESEGLLIIGVNLDAYREDAAEFLEEVPADFRIYFDTDGVLAIKYGVQAMPSSFVIGRDGELKASHRGFKVKQRAQYEAILEEALGEKH